MIKDIASNYVCVHVCVSAYEAYLSDLITQIVEYFFIIIFHAHYTHTHWSAV